MAGAAVFFYLVVFLPQKYSDQKLNDSIESCKRDGMDFWDKYRKTLSNWGVEDVDLDEPDFHFNQKLKTCFAEVYGHSLNAETKALSTHRSIFNLATGQVVAESFVSLEHGNSQVIYGLSSTDFDEKELEYMRD